jgi:hypothetical protein
VAAACRLACNVRRMPARSRCTGATDVSRARTAGSRSPAAHARQGLAAAHHRAGGRRTAHVPGVALGETPEHVPRVRSLSMSTGIGKPVARGRMHDRVVRCPMPSTCRASCGAASAPDTTAPWAGADGTMSAKRGHRGVRPASRGDGAWPRRPADAGRSAREQPQPRARGGDGGRPSRGLALASGALRRTRRTHRDLLPRRTAASSSSTASRDGGTRLLGNTKYLTATHSAFTFAPARSRSPGAQRDSPSPVPSPTPPHPCISSSATCRSAIPTAHRR